MLKGFLYLDIAPWRKALAVVFFIFTVVSAIKIFSIVAYPHPVFCGNSIFTLPCICLFSAIMMVVLLSEFK